MKRLIIIITAILAIFFAACEKENPYKIFNEVSFEMDQKILEGYFVTAIDFDSKGVAWIGTFNQGLLKYDNGLLTIYNSENSPLDSSFIKDIAVDKSDCVWIASNGLIKYDGNSFTKFDSSNTIMPLNFVGAIAIDKNNHVWLSSKGLLEFDGANWKLYTPSNSSMPSSHISDIETDSANNIWVALGDKVNNMSLIKISNHNWTMFSNESFGFDPYYWGKLAVSADNHIIASIDYGLSSMMDISRPNLMFGKNSNWVINNPCDKGGNSLGYISTICCDKTGMIWAALMLNPEFKKLAVFNGKKWFVNNDNLETGDIFVMKADWDNRIWLGTGSGIQIVKSVE